MINQSIILKKRPARIPKKEDFQLVSNKLPSLEEGQILIKNKLLLLSPFVRDRMSLTESYSKALEIGDVLPGAVVGEVISSRSSDIQDNSLVTYHGSWSQYGIVHSDMKGLRILPKNITLPMSAYLTILNNNGYTAWYGINRILGPIFSGKIAFVGAATGSVARVATALLKKYGCEIIGTASGVDKCRFAVDTLGYSACLDRKQHKTREEFSGALKEILNKKIDLFFENTGGYISDAVYENMALFGKVAVCGLISGYNNNSYTLHSYLHVLIKRLKIQGFIVSDDLSYYDESMKELEEIINSRLLSTTESIETGLHKAPSHFIRMLSGGNVGSSLIAL